MAHEFCKGQVRRAFREFCVGVSWHLAEIGGCQMELREVRRYIVDRLEQADRGDRGWFIATRVHVATSWLKGFAEYFEHLGGGEAIRLGERDYRRLAVIIESHIPNPGIQLRRHHLLVMDKPLQLIARTNGRLWSEIYLTDLGRELAYAVDPGEPLEKSLSAIRFAREPWTPHDRVEQYSQFDVMAYEVTKQVLLKSAGFIDRDEFDFFVSRIRNAAEIDWAVKGISLYRELTYEDQLHLRREVVERTPSAKVYQNWRDVALHTFSLFSLGTSMIRDGHRLSLTEAWVEDQTGAGPSQQPARRGRLSSTELRIPQPPELDLLLNPPTAPASNSGADGESFVAKILRSQGWEVAFYTNRRGYGFDLWARRGDRAMVLEVKSSLGALGEITLTSLEFRAAREYGGNYVLALVENVGSDDPYLRMIQNPVRNLRIAERMEQSYVITRAHWVEAAMAQA